MHDENCREHKRYDVGVVANGHGALLYNDEIDFVYERCKNDYTIGILIFSSCSYPFFVSLLGRFSFSRFGSVFILSLDHSFRGLLFQASYIIF
ncbi:hypothetical protein L6452_06748 [Arctium lappa]|uniref:Uncharacterized protein n=1 Tax=Arctium lappa TaxID=4217 RepID=A0ACB9EKN0_ARCLA|nr:hypothetical protein L6452_06748 [Arctium lappa]